MPKLPRVSGWEVADILERLGFFRGRIKGSHMVLRKPLPEGDIVCVVPLHKELATGTLRSVLRQAQISADDFIAAM
jgi:predicted RNA binding protein YcfA (HicA-like mRNA interferase family)